MDITHPKLRQLEVFWQAKTEGRPMPARPDIDVIELRPWLGNLILLETIDAGADFRYRVYGTNLVTYFGRDLTGDLVSGLQHKYQAVVYGEYAAVVETRRPLAIQHLRYIGALGLSTRMTVEKLILPLSTDGDVVDMLLAGVYAHKIK